APPAPAPVAYEARAAAAGGAEQSAIAGSASFGLEGDPGEFVFDPFEAPQSRAAPSPAPLQRVQPRAQPIASARPATAQQAGFAPARPQPAASLAA
ncbi:MAG TPA: hypothetical protein DFS52_01275, partial [Myxococcales bacterium]|nr:hypothetical protein [Myxococcales bacterium]